MDASSQPTEHGRPIDRLLVATRHVSALRQSAHTQTRVRSLARQLKPHRLITSDLSLGTIGVLEKTALRKSEGFLGMAGR